MTDETHTRGPGGRPTPGEERSHREEAQPDVKTTHDGDRDVFAGDAPDSPSFGNTAEPVAPGDEAVSRG